MNCVATDVDMDMRYIEFHSISYVRFMFPIYWQIASKLLTVKSSETKLFFLDKLSLYFSNAYVSST